MNHELRRMACVDLPDLPLQSLLRAQPALRDVPACVVAEDHPEAQLLLINRHAREMRLRTGMRFGAAKSLVPELRAGTVSAVELEQGVAQIVRALQTFSPHVERDPVSAGVFYLDPAGLSRLYGGEQNWARCVYRFLTAKQFYASVVVGFGRTLSYVLARSVRGVKVFERPEEVLKQAREVDLERLHITPKLRDALDRLGVNTLGDLSEFGADQLKTRFGAEASLWCRVAHGEEVLPLCSEPHVKAARSEVEIDPPDDDIARLCFGLKRGLDLLLEDVRKRGQSVRKLWMHLVFERGPASVQCLEPSVPTRDAALLLELLRLRLSALNIGRESAAQSSLFSQGERSKIERVVLEAETSDLAAGQLNMFVPKRDLAAGARALARLKASYGEDVACRATLEDAHLPEERFRFVSSGRIEKPKAEDVSPHALLPSIRRVLLRPEPFSGELVVEPESRNKKLIHAGEVFELSGPQRVTSAWWARPVARDYYYARSPRGELLWLFYDALRSAWFLHGYVD